MRITAEDVFYEDMEDDFKEFLKLERPLIHLMARKQHMSSLRSAHTRQTSIQASS